MVAMVVPLQVLVKRRLGTFASHGRKRPRTASTIHKEYASEQVSDPEEHENHDRDDQRHQPDHRQKAWLIVAVVHSIEARPRPSGATRSATR